MQIAATARRAMAKAFIDSLGAGAKMNLHAADGALLGSATISAASVEGDGIASVVGEGAAGASGEIAYLALVSNGGEEIGRVGADKLGMADPRTVKGAHLGPVKAMLNI